MKWAGVGDGREQVGGDGGGGDDGKKFLAVFAPGFADGIDEGDGL